ncbi:unnamed protein product [Rhizoctonia solani]|uniref:F-box domain-containing protein n=1 Tax=Rhizoctonia solani TaxID=456999 RepID=A0A8H3CVA6_9AGAM|nr:unnamed protein product [Rhizoctonia solani]
MIQLQAIKEASEQLHTAWEHYLQACSDLDNLIWQRETYYDPCRGFLQYIDDELARLSRYEENAQRAQRTLKRVRQCACYLAPIHSLPSEILLRIFYVLLAGPCSLGQLNYETPVPQNQKPGPITQVCSRWRNIATSSPFLWTHVDIPLTQPSAPRLLSRAKLHVQQSANLPLELHVYSAGDNNSQTGYTPVIQLLETVAGQARTLNFTLNYYDYAPFHLAILPVFLSNCSIEIFNRLVTSSFPYSSSPYLLSELEDFDEVQESSSNGVSQVEKYFSGLSALDLKGCYPYWSSSAFHGLVDLRLAPSPDRHARICTLHISELIDILTASPGLRIFYFSLKVSDVETADSVTLPIPLKDLEVLNLSFTRRTPWSLPQKVGNILRLLGPGSKALRLTLDCEESSYELLDSADELREFFMRSKVEKLCLRGVNHFSERMLSYTPDVKVLLLEGCAPGKFEEVDAQTHNSYALYGSGHSTGFTLNESDYDTLLILPRLQSCYIRTSSTMDTTLHTLARLCPTGLLVDGKELTKVATRRDTYIPFAEIPNHFPTVKFQSFPSMSALTADWDVL